MLPSAAPFILAALRITLPAAMIGAVTGEFISSTPLARLLPAIPAVRDHGLRRRLWEATEALLNVT